MKTNRLTSGLAAIGLACLAPAVRAQTGSQQDTPLLTSLSATTISGYDDTSVVWNPGTGNANPAPYAFNAGKQERFNLDAVDIKLSKPLEEGKWSAGYVAELNYGADSFGIDGGAAPIRQAYVDLGVPVGNGLELKLGRFDKIIGYESNDTMDNPNWTHSYGYTFDPTEHTGLLASYQFADWIGLQVGAADTLTTAGINTSAITGPAVEKLTFLSLLTLTAPESWGAWKGSTLSGAFDHGQGVYGADTTEFYVGATVNTPLTGLSVGASWDSIESTVVASVNAGYFQAVAGYLTYKINDKANINGRVEYADGTPLGILADAINGGAGNPLDKVLAFTGTFEYDLWANVMSRLEIRWDHEAGGGGPAFGGEVAGVPTKNNEFTIAANVIYKF